MWQYGVSSKYDNNQYITRKAKFDILNNFWDIVDYILADFYALLDYLYDILHDFINILDDFLDILDHFFDILDEF